MLVGFGLKAQTARQTLRGQLIDQASKYPIPGAVVQVVGQDTICTTITDLNGEYKFTNLPVGTYHLKAKMVGYEDQSLSNIEVISGKVSVVNIPIKEALITMEGVTVTVKKQPGSLNSKDAVVSARSFTPDEAQRYPGSFEDPARMASAFAGVATNPTGNNDIIVRGNSPRGVLWRIEGVEAPNPNHFSGLGSSGGAISMLSNFSLGNSDFYTSAFPSPFGNATSGVFDIRLRNGNRDEKEYSIDINTLGLRASAEGPFKKGGKSSYLVNYRYSSLGLLDAVGISFGGIPKYQDLCYKLNLKTDKMGTFSVFGLLGQGSMNDESYSENDSDLLISKGRMSYYSGITGLNHLIFLNNKTSIKSGVAFSGMFSENWSDDLQSDQVTFRRTGTSDVKNYSILWKASLNTKLDAKNTLTTGLYYDQLFYDMDLSGYDPSIQSQRSYVKSSGQTGLTRAYVNWNYTPWEDWKFVSGVHFTYFNLNQNTLVEPRLSAEWKFVPKQKLTLGYGLHSRRENASIYLAEIQDANGNFTEANEQAKLQQSQHFVLGHEVQLFSDFRLKTEVYYQYLFNLLVEDDANSSYALINEPEGYVNRKLVNDGVGRNYGVDITAEKYFSNSYFFLVTTSLFDSKYKAKDNVWRNTRYNMQYMFNVMGGKDFDLSNERKDRTLTASAKLVYGGGNYDTPIDYQQSVQKGETVYQEEKAFTEKMPNVTKLDVQLKLTTNREKSTRVWMIDVQNVTNNKAIVYRSFQAFDNSINQGTQLQMIPMLSYKIIF